MRRFFFILKIVFLFCSQQAEVLDGGGDIENLDRTAKKFLEYVKDF